jgi:hypothetical protein
MFVFTYTDLKSKTKPNSLSTQLYDGFKTPFTPPEKNFNITDRPSYTVGITIRLLFLPFIILWDIISSIYYKFSWRLVFAVIILLIIVLFISADMVYRNIFAISAIK